MLDKAPNAEEMTALVGQSLYDIWNVCGIKVVKHGNMSINIVEVAKHYVHDMQEKIVWDL